MAIRILLKNYVFVDNDSYAKNTLLKTIKYVNLIYIKKSYTEICIT